MLKKVWSGYLIRFREASTGGDKNQIIKGIGFMTIKKCHVIFKFTIAEIFHNYIHMVA